MTAFLIFMILFALLNMSPAGKEILNISGTIGLAVTIIVFVLGILILFGIVISQFFIYIMVLLSIGLLSAGLLSLLDKFSLNKIPKK